MITNPLMRRNQLLVIIFYILFAISTAIVLIASTTTTPLPALGGYIDVGLVVLIAINGILIRQGNTGMPRYDLAHTIAIYLFPLTLVLMWIFRGAIDFNILLPGLAWRTYLFLSILPRAITLWNAESLP